MLIDVVSPFIKLLLLVPGSSNGKYSAWNKGDRVQFLGNENPLEKEMVTYSSILAWRIPQTEPGGPQSMELQRVKHN